MIRVAQIFEDGKVACFNEAGKKISERIEPSVKSFVEIELKRGSITDSTTVYHPKSGRVTASTVKQLKKDLGIARPFWARFFKR